jgi:hypothetical protein
LVFAPESLDVDSVENFEWDVPGAHYAMGRRHLKDVVKRFLATTGGTVHSGLLVLAKKHFGSRRPTSLADPWRRTVLGLNDPQLDENQMELLLWGSFYPDSAFFSTSPVGPKKYERTYGRKNHGGDYKLVGIAVDGFDAGSYIIWWREELTPFPLESAP